MKRKANKSASTESALTVCEVCESPFIPELSKPCKHICDSCELVLLKCPVCISSGNDFISGSTSRLGIPSKQSKKANLDQVVGDILVSQQQEQMASTDGSFKNPQEKEKMSFQTQLIRTCFLGVWDGLVRSAIGVLGIKSQKNSFVARNANNVLVRVGRQTGRRIFPNVFKGMKPNPVSLSSSSSAASVKIVGGLAVAAIVVCYQVMSRK